MRTETERRRRGRANTRSSKDSRDDSYEEDPSLSLSLSFSPSLHLDDFIKITGPRSFYPPISKRLSVECLLLLLWSPSGRKIIRDGSRDTRGKKKRRRRKRRARNASSSRGFFHGPLNNEPRMGKGGRWSLNLPDKHRKVDGSRRNCR